MRFFRLAGETAVTFWLAATLAGCATPANKLSDRGFTRVAHPDTNIIQLQIAIQQFAPRFHSGPTIWLVGVMHIGEPQYYQALQEYLAAATVVLYEGVNADAHGRKASATNEEPAPKASESGGFSMQAELAKSLGLVFQLDAIDYNRTNFLNSDLSIAQIQRLMAKQVMATTNQAQNSSFDALLQIMDGSSFLGSLFKFGIRFIGATPHLQALAKVTLIEAIGNLQSDFSNLKGMPPDMQQLIEVLIQARNQKVMDNLKSQLKTMSRTGAVAIFFGTGHMEDLKKRLGRQLFYHPIKKIWLPAMSVNMSQSGLAPAEVTAISRLVKSQLQQLTSP